METMTILWIIFAIVIGTGASIIFLMLMDDASGQLLSQKNHTILDTTPKTEMDMYEKTLSFCYLEPKNFKGDRVLYIVCNYVDMDQEKLNTARDFLENYSQN